MTWFWPLGVGFAFGIGLHRERPSVEEKIVFERHRRLLWVVYCFDSGFSITTGRSMAVLEGFIDKPLPRNIYDRVSHYLGNTFPKF